MIENEEGLSLMEKTGGESVRPAENMLRDYTAEEDEKVDKRDGTDDEDELSKSCEKPGQSLVVEKTCEEASTENMSKTLAAFVEDEKGDKKRRREELDELSKSCEKFLKASKTDNGASDLRTVGMLGNTDEINPQRYKKRKIALIVAYCGAGYQGMQRNPGAITIEGELEEALFRAGAISESNFGDPRKVDWMRAARTDKGVSAVGQVVSGNFVIDPPGFVQRVNAHLPTKIKVLGYTRVIQSFNAKNLCDYRRYEYIVPVFAFDPTAHLDRESQLNVTRNMGLIGFNEKKDSSSTGTGSEISRVEEQVTILHQQSPLEGDKGASGSNMAQQQVIGNENVVTWEASIAANGATESKIVSLDSSEELTQSIEGDSINVDLAHKANILGSIGNQDSKLIPLEAAKSSEKPTFSWNKSKNGTFEFGEIALTRLNRILSLYVGTHNFYNFTARIKADDPSALRHIHSFEAEKTFSINGMEFVRCTVVGQSFMLHQIRKMIGLAIAIMRGRAPESIIGTALTRHTKVNVPLAPELGLFLQECYYRSYNKRFHSTHAEVSLKEFMKEAAEFKREFIYQHIASTEAQHGVVALWLHSLTDSYYPEFVAAREREHLLK